MIATIRGKQFEVAPEPADFWGWVARGNYNAEWEILEKLVRPEDTFIDLGAWVGSHSLYASTKARQVISVEPDPVAFEILEANLKPIGVLPQRTAVGQEGMITLGSGRLGASTTRANPHAGSGIGPWEQGQQFDIASTTLRNFAKDLPDPLFIKIDIEGDEEYVMRDFEFFKERKPTLSLETHPFWWANEATWDNIRRIAGLYRNVLNLQMNPIDLSAVTPRHVVLTDNA